MESIQVRKAKDKDIGIPSAVFFHESEFADVVFLAPCDSWGYLIARRDIACLIDALEKAYYLLSDGDIEISNQIYRQEIFSSGGRIVRGKTTEEEVADDNLPKPTNGYVYLIHSVGTTRYKIGRTADLDRRLKRLREQSPFPLAMIHSFHTEDSITSESE